MHRLSSLPGITRQAMKDCGVPERTRTDEMRRILGETADIKRYVPCMEKEGLAALPF